MSDHRDYVNVSFETRQTPITDSASRRQMHQLRDTGCVRREFKLTLRSRQSQLKPPTHYAHKTDFHQLAEDRIAAEAADLLRKRALSNDFDTLVVVAPPNTLGELLKHYHKEVTSRIVFELDKDLAGRPVEDIEVALTRITDAKGEDE